VDVQSDYPSGAPGRGAAQAMRACCGRHWTCFNLSVASLSFYCKAMLFPYVLFWIHGEDGLQIAEGEDSFQIAE
jgi:hypothetical protein